MRKKNLDKVRYQGANIKRMRQDMNMTQEELAGRLDRQRVYISNWEHNIWSPSKDEWTALLAIYAGFSTKREVPKPLIQQPHASIVLFIRKELRETCIDAQTLSLDDAPRLNDAGALLAVIDIASRMYDEMMEGNQPQDVGADSEGADSEQDNDDMPI